MDDMWEIRQLILFIHIFAAIIWVGGILFVGWGVLPASRNLSYSTQRRFFLSIMEWTHWIFTLSGVTVIITGVLLGTTFGPLKNWTIVLETTYGNIWLSAFIIAFISLAWGVFISYPLAMKLFKNVALWENADIGYKKPLSTALNKYIALESVEVIGFIILIYLMIIF